MGIRIVTKSVIMAAALSLGLAACGPQGGSKAPGAEQSAGGGGLMDGLFPKRTASYKATYEMTGGPAEASAAGPLTMTVYAGGGKQRMEFNIMSMKRVMLMDPTTQVSYSFTEGPGAPKIATKLDASEFDKFDYKVDENAAVKPKKVGGDTVAGLSCAIWETMRANATPEDKPMQVCVTDDGIMLRVGPKDSPQMLATEVNKGPQDGALFTLPAGYTVVDMGDCMKVFADMRSGAAKPSQAKLKECAQKMGGMGAP